MQSDQTQPEDQPQQEGQVQLQPDYRAYEQYYRDATEAGRADSAAYDRSLLTLASAFLLVSITFISDVTPLAEASHVWLLQVGWGFLVLTILVTLTSFQVAEFTRAKLILKAREYYLLGNRDPDILSQKWTWRFRWMNWSAGGLFALGVIGLTMFVWLNVLGEEAADNREIIQRGEVVQPFNQVPATQQQPQPEPSPQQEN